MNVHKNWIEIYQFHLLYVTFVTVKLNSLFQYFSSFNTSDDYTSRISAAHYEASHLWSLSQYEPSHSIKPRTFEVPYHLPSSVQHHVLLYIYFKLHYNVYYKIHPKNSFNCIPTKIL